MIYIYDILLNFQKDIYEYYEWSKDDTITHIKRIKLFKISSLQMEDLFNYDIKFSNSFLELIYNTTEVYRKTNMMYAALFTDGYRTLAVNINSNGKSISKSRLLLEEEEEIIGISDRVKEFSIKYKKLKKHKQDLYTRLEKKEKNYLEKSIKRLYKNKNYSFLAYLYLEYFGNGIDDYNDMYKKLIDSLSTITINHERLIEILELANKKKSKT